MVEGLTLAPLTEALRSRFSIPERVEGLAVTAVAEGSRAARDGYEAGFVILQANNRPVRTVAEFRAAVAARRAAGGDSIFLLVRTSRGNVPVVLELSRAAAE